MPQLQKIANPELTNSILENIGALVLVADSSGLIVYCSPSVLQFLKADKSEVLGTGWWKLTRRSEEIQTKEIETIKKIIAGEIPISKTPHTNSVLDKEGNEYWIQWQDTLGPDNTLIGVGQNITDHYKAEKIIQQQQIQLKRLSLVAEKTNNIILILNKAGNVEWVSESFEKLNKITLAELIATKGPNILDISNNPRIAEILNRVINEKISLTYESKNTNIKEAVWELSTISPVLNEEGELTNIIIIDSDITDKKKMEAELEKLSIVASKTDNAVVIANAEGVIEWANEGLAKMHSKKIVSPKHILGKNLLELSSNPNFETAFAKCMQQKISVIYESESKNDEGKNFWVQSTLTPILDSNNNVSKLVIIDADITEQKHAESIIREKNKDITDSINYAMRIQNALLPDKEKINTLLPESFVLFLPRDIVSGDFYFVDSIRMNDGTMLIGFAVGDCTGHGVPGAFMSMIGTSYMKQSLKEHTVSSPAQALDFVSNQLNNLLFHHDDSHVIKDGIDIGFCVLHNSSLTMNFAGANRPVIIISKDGLTQIKGDSRAVGFSEKKEPFTNHVVQLKKGDCIYLLSDGYADQFGGPKGKKFKHKQLLEVLQSIHEKPMTEQKQILFATFNQWKGHLDQVDDVLIMGVKL